ncbi:MAG: hypothetical protein IJ223_06270 [Clostridia bacterium]|nr:hypothetical protein [Clostridia bacterium]
MCGFPISSMSKMISKLENNKIDYLILDRRNNYDVDERVEFKNLNNYSKVYNKAKKAVNIDIRINEINKYIRRIENEAKLLEVLRKIENVINETR